MREGFVVCSLLLLGQLFCPLVELRGHFRGFLRGAAHRHHHGGEVRYVHFSARNLILLRSLRIAAWNSARSLDPNRFNSNARQRFAFFSATSGLYRRIPDFAQDVVAGEELAKSSIVAV